MKTSRTSTRRLALGLVAAAALSAGTLLAWSARARPDDAPAAAARPALSVTVVQLRPAQWVHTVSANGSLFAWQEASVGAEANGWRLAEVRVNVGDVVRRGQVLASFDPAMARADLAQVRASVAEAEAALAEAAANAQRARDLQASGALSAQQIQQMLTGERTAQARLEAARASQQVQELRLKQTQVLAPDDGVISARTATVGAVVPAGQELFRLIRQGRLEWRAEVAASELARVRIGQAVRLTPTGGSTVAGRVRMVAPTVDPATRNGLVYVDLPTAAGAGAGAGAARAGMFARGEFEVGQAPAMTLPQSAVVLRDGYAYVYRVGADGKVAQAKVGVGRRVGDRIEITGGLDARERVVEQGGGFLTDGDLVRVVASPPGRAGAGSTASSAAAAKAAPASAARR